MRRFTPCSTGQSGTQWTQTLPGSLAPSDYRRMPEAWSWTNWNILRGRTKQLSAPPDTRKHSEIQKHSENPHPREQKDCIFSYKCITGKSKPSKFQQLPAHSLEHSINAINTPSVALKETNKQMPGLKEYVNYDCQNLYWGAESEELNSFCKHRVVREANATAALSI